MYGGKRHRALVKGGLGHGQAAAVAVAPRVRGDGAGLPGEQVSGATARNTLIWVVFALTLRQEASFPGILQPGGVRTKGILSRITSLFCINIFLWVP